MASDFQITFWGTRGSIAVSEPHSQRFGGNTTCVTFKMGDKTLIIDAGTGIRAVSEDILSSMDKNRDRELYLFFSHMHWDHIQGFPFFVPAYMPDFTLNIFADEEKSENLQKLLVGQMHSQYFPVSFDYLEARMNFFSVPKELQMKDFSISTLHII